MFSSRVYIPKPGSEKKRPLGIPAYEDKLVQLGINKIISAIYEQDFLECSYGFRPSRSCHKALSRLDTYLSMRNTNYVVDADIKGFLKAGVMEEGCFHKSYEGTPQGGIISPTLANIYLHYVLDLWFEKRIKKWCKGEAYIVRYADDFVCCFEYENEANSFYRALKERLGQFNLEMAEDKSKIIYFGKQAYLERKAGFK